MPLNKKLIEDSIKELNTGKSNGYDNMSAEMLVHSNSTNLIKLLTWFFSSVFTYGLVPDKFNVSIVTSIPKGKELGQSQSNFRPISVSTPLTNIFEIILLSFIPNIKEPHCNQFGYQSHVSCKHAYFLINETVHYNKSLNRNLDIVQLDAEKAFDSL